MVLLARRDRKVFRDRKGKRDHLDHQDNLGLLGVRDQSERPVKTEGTENPDKKVNLGLLVFQAKKVIKVSADLSVIRDKTEKPENPDSLEFPEKKVHKGLLVMTGNRGYRVKMDQMGSPEFLVKMGLLENRENLLNSQKLG